MYIDVLGVWVVLVVAHEGDGCLVVQKEGGGALDVAKHLGDEVMEPEGFLATMHHCDVLTLGGRQGDNLLPLRRLQDSATINEKCIARYGTAVFGHAAICICITLQRVVGLAISKPQVMRA